MASSLLNVLGLVVAMVGSGFLYFNVPTVWKTVNENDITTTAPDEFHQQKANSRRGFFLLLVGFVLQVLASVLTLFHF